MFFLWSLPGKPEARDTPPLRVAMVQEATNLTPYSAGVPESLLELVYDKLAAPFPYLANASPWLAESIEPQGNDGRMWKIRLRKGIFWHDGNPFTADDVAFTFRYYRDGIANRWTHHTDDTQMLDTVMVLDGHSLLVGCSDPCPDFDRVTAADLPILPAHIWRKVSKPNLHRGPIIGTGPFRLAGIASGRHLVLEANSGYFGGTPKVKAVRVSFIRNPATAFAALCAGQVDMVSFPVPPELGDALARQPGLELKQSDPMTAVEIRLNFDRFPFSDPAFRQVLALAVSPGEVLERVILGRGRPGTLGYPHPNSPWTRPGLSQRSDPSTAVARLDALGFLDRDGDGMRDDPNGRPLVFGLSVSGGEPLHLRAAEVVARQLESIRIRTTIEVLDPARHRALFSNRQFDLMLGEISPHGISDPDQFVQSHKSGYLWREGLPYPELEARMDRWRRSITRAERLAASHSLQSFSREAPTAIVLYYPNARWAYRPEAFADWRPIPGLGLFHKWSLIRTRFSVPGVP